jgi:redox-sensitive bicupin YhaK (pirin superfamily)
MNLQTSRNAQEIVKASPFTHGTGFHAFSIGRQQLGPSIHPFLQLDHYFMTQPTFSEHPHQGIAAVTYMFEDSEGTFFNEDSQGDRSYIRPGDLHWTQAGSGIRHNETPVEPGQVCHGIQMFVDLPAADKVAPAKALHVQAVDIPVYHDPAGARVRVVIGAAHGLVSPLEISDKIDFLDVMIPANGGIDHEIPVNRTAFVFAIAGAGAIGELAIQSQSAALLDSQSPGLRMTAGPDGLQYILCIH